MATASALAAGYVAVLAVAAVSRVVAAAVVVVVVVAVLGAVPRHVPKLSAGVALLARPASTPAAAGARSFRAVPRL